MFELMYRCVICDNEVVTLASVNTMDIIFAWKLQGVLIAPPEFDKVYLTRCPNCSLELWQPALIGGSDFYSQLSSFAWYYESDKWEYQVAHKWIKKDASVLEVGCGKGEFLKLLTANRINAVGIDTNLCAIESARSNGLNVIGLDLQDFAASTDELFDIVCHFQVLEHIPKPLQFLETCAKLLKPGGEILIATPNQDSFIRYAPFLILNMPPHHQARWSVSAYQIASQKLNLQLDKMDFEPLNKLHTGLALQSFVNKYLQVGINLPFSVDARPIWLWAILKAVELFGRFIFYPEWIRKHIRGHSVLIGMRRIQPSQG
jgi:SAM-dependent methyltransferase